VATTTKLNPTYKKDTKREKTKTKQEQNPKLLAIMSLQAKIPKHLK
jgi:hypothetical protein